MVTTYVTTRPRTRRHPSRIAIPTTMHAAAIDRFGPPSVLKLHELPVPEISPTEVLIAVHTAGVASSVSGPTTEAKDAS